MPASAGIGHGITFAIGNGASPEVFADVAELLDGDGPGMSKDSVQITSGESTDRWREFIPGLRDGGEITFEFNLVSANLTALKANFDLDANSNYRIVIPAPVTKTWDVVGHLSALEPTYPQEDRMTGSFTLKVSGEPVLS